MVRGLQPGIIVDNRLEVSGEGHGSLAECRPTPYHGDFITPETMIPPRPLRDAEGQPLVWESCVTMNDHWGYCAKDRRFKPAGFLVRKLVECVSKGGNMILNVGPDARGNFPPQSVEILAEIGRWMKRNGGSIYGCGAAEDIPKPEYGRITRRGNVLYYHLLENALGPMPLPGVKPGTVKSVRLLHDASEAVISTSWVHSDYPDVVYVNLGFGPVLPDGTDTVLEVTLKEENA